MSENIQSISVIVLTLQGYEVCQKEFHDLSSQILSRPTEWQDAGRLERLVS